VGGLGGMLHLISVCFDHHRIPIITHHFYHDTLYLSQPFASIISYPSRRILHHISPQHIISITYSSYISLLLHHSQSLTSITGGGGGGGGSKWQGRNGQGRTLRPYRLPWEDCTGSSNFESHWPCCPYRKPCEGKISPTPLSYKY
jgi:hypothetical protein